MKECTKCGEDKPLDEYHRDNRRPQGRMAACKVCRLAASKVSLSDLETLERKRATGRKAYHNNKEHYLEYQRDYRKINRGLTNSYTASRRAAQMQRTPSWADKVAIKLKYDWAKTLETLTLGLVKYHVDHIVPLQGELVSGLHVENNLQVLRAEDNCSKGNKF